MNGQNFHHGFSPRHEEERPQKAGAGAREVVTGLADGHVRLRIGGTKAYNIYCFLVAALEVIYLAVRRCGAFMVSMRPTASLPSLVGAFTPHPPFPAHGTL